jgi:hypothetical protein
MTPEEHLAVPYVLVMESIERPNGEWVRRASHPELPGCVVEATSPLDALDQLHELRVRYILDHLARGEVVPVPRPPLRARRPVLDPERLEFARWLVQQGRVDEGHKQE